MESDDSSLDVDDTNENESSEPPANVKVSKK